MPSGLCKCGCGQRTPLAKVTSKARGLVKGEPTHYIRGHQRRGSGRPVGRRFWEKVDKRDGGCWIWTASLATNGYGRFYPDPDGVRGVPAHRFAYEDLVGPIPDGLDLDHLCRNRACVKPSHLEPVTRRVNAARGIKGALTTHCPKGHEYTPENTYIRQPEGHRMCRACARERMRKKHS